MVDLGELVYRANTGNRILAKGFLNCCVFSEIDRELIYFFDAEADARQYLLTLQAIRWNARIDENDLKAVIIKHA